MACCFLITGCSDDDFFDAQIDERLQPYYDRFVEEGAARGIIIKFDSIPISGQLTRTLTSNVAGLCRRLENSANLIQVNENYWNAVGDLQREFVMFHELGHCYLDREHLDTQDENGLCLSMMASGVSGCNPNYTLTTRETFIDELFFR